MSDWALILSSVGAFITAVVGIFIAVSTRKKAQGDVTLTITQAAENIVAMREKQIAELEAKIRDREADVVVLKEKVLDRDRGLEALNAKLEARESDIRDLKVKVQQLYRYVDYLHKFIAAKGKKRPMSLDMFIQQQALAKTHFEENL